MFWVAVAFAASIKSVIPRQEANYVHISVCNAELERLSDVNHELHRQAVYLRQKINRIERCIIDAAREGRNAKTCVK